MVGESTLHLADVGSIPLSSHITDFQNGINRSSAWWSAIGSSVESKVKN